ncbi:MAG TPA: glycosyl transferase family 2 [Vicinamibacteria bacterium]|nr:glycosyl transferase family 2 [Vicinamibacteria bacterium]
MSVPLEPAVAERVRELGSAELVVGIPSFDNARTIGHVVRAVAAGLAKHFPGHPAVIVNSDGGSRDGTPQVVASTELGSPQAILARHPLGPVHKILTPYHGLPGKGSALRTIFAIAERLGARACAVVDSDLRSITPGWIELLIGPILEHGFDYVAPLYLRHKYDGTITNSVVYPLTRSLYGREVRQPIGGEFGFSGRLASHYLARPVWESDVARFGIDIWMTTTALADGFRVCESFLGAKIHDPKDPGADLAAMLVQVVSAVFDLMETYHRRWAAVETAEAVPLFGFPHGVGLEPVSVNVARMIGVFEQGVRDLREVWASALEPDALRDVAALAGAGEPAFHFPDRLWVRVVHDFAIAYRRRVLPRDQLLRSLVPLYLGRTASFVLATRESDATEVEAAIRALADEFVRQKPDLCARWPERAGSKEA